MFGMRFGQLGTVSRAPSLAERIAQMFARSEQGVWYDPSNLSTLFQDSAFTVPVTAVEQPVGGMLDLSGRGNHASQPTTTKRPIYSRRVNQFTKTENFSDAAWKANLFNNWFVNNARSAAAAPSPRGDFTATTISFTAPQGAVCVGQRAAVSPGVYRAALWMRLTPGVSSLGSAFMNIMVANGNSNALVLPYPVGQNIGPQLSEVWKMFTIEHTVPPSGVNQVELLINKQATPETCSVDVWGGSLTLATDAHIPYQRVNTATDYDADPAKFPAYLLPDSVDDAMATIGNVNLSSAQQLAVVSGYCITKGTGTSLLAELTSVSTTGGAFSLFPRQNDGECGWSIAYPQMLPKTAARPLAEATVNAVCFDRGGASTAEVFKTLRLNGENITPAHPFSSQNPTFANDKLYLFARNNGTTHLMGGRFYGLIVRGAQSSLSQIEATEAYIKQKMKLP